MLAPGGDSLEIALPRPVRLWSCAAPNLYDVALTVRSAAGTDEAQDQYWEFMGIMTFDRAVVKFDFDFLRSVHAEIYEAARAGAVGSD